MKGELFIKKKISLLLILILSLVTSNAFAAIDYNIPCSTGTCNVTNSIDEVSGGSHLYFKAGSYVLKQPTYTGSKIHYTKAVLIGYEGTTTIVSSDTGKESDLISTAGKIYTYPISGRSYRNQSYHYFYKADGTAFTDDNSVSYIY